jgi:multisubunit Na+/H+ antiporter MnhB subunit
MNQRLRHGLIVVPLVFGLGLLLQNSGNAPSGAAITGLVIIVVVASCIMLAIRALWGKRRRNASANAGLVTICITAPVIAVPDIRQAYQMLPDHCFPPSER